MITGKITSNLDAVIEVEVVGSDQKKKIEAIIDTGFYGFLILPSDLINRLTLQRIGNQPAFLGDGNEVDFNVYLTKVLWDGEEREVTALESDAGPLIGMSLLYGSRVILNVINDGDVSINALH
ncbi:MAG: clan AA aspartic protease [Candidatus Poribacteria bacterium]|nr:clan AA aspartic protease [Candidatus Poribacteria bacterium]